MKRVIHERGEWSRTVPFFTSLKDAHVWIAGHLIRGERVIRASLSYEYGLYKIHLEVWRDGQ